MFRVRPFLCLFGETFCFHYDKFEDGILDACLRILNENPKFHRNPDDDCSGRRNPVYVSRVLSAMVSLDLSMMRCDTVELCVGREPINFAEANLSSVAVLLSKRLLVWQAAKGSDLNLVSLEPDHYLWFCIQLIKHCIISSAYYEICK